MNMYENATTAAREPCKHCNQNHDEIECARPEHDETELFDALYDYSAHKTEQGETPSPKEALEQVLGHEIKGTEYESLKGIAENAIRDAKRDV